MSAADHSPLGAGLEGPDSSPFVEIAEAARLAGMSASAIRKRCATDGLGFKPGGRGPWRIRRAVFDRFMRGEVLR